jgi:hypothetical protein
MMRIGAIPGKGSLVTQKRQRKTGGSKNVYILGMSPAIYNSDGLNIKATMESMGGEALGQRNAFVFTKRPAAEKAWAYFVLRWC